uniref:ENTH domain-containing protein n=1 Tax=Oryza glaberrima TaxID=4538 RepID=I1R6T9_ORYGL
MLNMSDFCDRSRNDAWDFSAFVRTYAAYLDDRLEYRMQAKHGGAARQGRPLREQLYASSGNRFNYDDFIMRDDEATNTEADKAMALVARETPTSEMTLEQLLAKAQLLLAPHCLLLPVAMVVVVLALEKKLLVVVLACLEEHL